MRAGTAGLVAPLSAVLATAADCPFHSGSQRCITVAIAVK